MKNQSKFAGLLVFAAAVISVVLSSYQPTKPPYNISFYDVYRDFVAEAQLGIDLGTTYSVAAICFRGEVNVVAVDGHELTPSVVHFPSLPKGREKTDLSFVEVGHAAKERRKEWPGQSVHGSKRFIGLKYSEVSFAAEETDIEIGSDEAENAVVVIRVEGEAYLVSPELVAAQILLNMKKFSEKAGFLPWIKRKMGFKFSSVVVSIPVSFTQDQKLATIRAGEFAGFSSVTLIEEPVAAAMSYGLHEQESSTNGPHYVLVFDIGGGTLDVALLFLDSRIGNFLIDTTAGLPRLGGEDFDFALAELILEKYAGLQGNSSSIGIRNDRRKWSLLMQAAERLKHTLTVDNEAEICIGENHIQSVKSKITTGVDDSGDSPAFVNVEKCTLENNGSVVVRVSRPDFEDKIQPIVNNMLDPVKQVLHDARLTADAKLNVVLVGGTSRIPKVRSQLQKYLKNAKFYYEGIDPDKAVAIGAARSRGCTFK